MACRLFGTKQLPAPMMTYFQLDPYEHNSMKFYWTRKSFIDEIAFENVICQNDNHVVSLSMCQNGSSLVHISQITVINHTDIELGVLGNLFQVYQSHSLSTLTDESE